MIFPIVATYLLTALLMGLACFQLALALGAPWGEYAWGGQPAQLPIKLRLGSVLAIPILSWVAVVFLTITQSQLQEPKRTTNHDAAFIDGTGLRAARDGASVKTPTDTGVGLA